MLTPRIAGTTWAATPVLTPFVDSLPLPATLAATGTYTETGRGTGPLYDLPVGEIKHKFHRDLPSSRLWGYKGTFPGPTIVANSGQPVFVRFANNLKDAPHPLWSDAFNCLHGPDMSDPPSARRIITHLHGARTTTDSDGWPEHTLLPGQVTAKPFWYPNIQEASTL